MAGRECYHCKQWVEEGEAHDCWTTTEAALTRELSEELQDAWARLREAAAELGEQRIYASHNSIMFSRKSCYFFVRPKKSFLEVCVFLGRPVNAPEIRRVIQSSKTKIVHVIHIKHRDEVEAPITDWLREAYRYSSAPAPMTVAAPAVAIAKARSAKSKTKTHARARSARKTASRKAVVEKEAAPVVMRSCGGLVSSRRRPAAASSDRACPFAAWLATLGSPWRRPCPTTCFPVHSVRSATTGRTCP